MQAGFRRGGVLLSVTALIISTVLNILYRRHYFQMGVNFIYNYQTSYQTAAITVIQNIISILGNTFFIVAFLIVVHLLAFRKLASVVYIFYIVCNAYLIAVEKQAYQDPRPFFYNANIQALQWTCPRSYGFPSGHSWVSVLLYEPVIADLIGTVGWRKSILLWIVLTGTLIPISRQYLGSHTADQVTSGVLHSMSALILYKCLFQDSIYRLLARAFKGISLGVLLTVNSICFGLSVAVPFIIYRINISDKAFDPAFITLMNAGCGRDYTQADLQKEAGTAGSIIGLIFGFVYGFAIASLPRWASTFSSGDGRRSIYWEYLRGRWNFRGRCVNVFKYIIFYVIFGGVCVGVIGYAIPAGFNNFYGGYILQTVGYCLLGMAIAFFIPLLLIKTEAIGFDEEVAYKAPSSEPMGEGKSNEQFTPKNLAPHPAP